MFSFSDGARISDINNVATFFKRVNYPAQALHVDTKAYLDRFFGTGGFVTMCDQIFGPPTDFLFQDSDTLCWMDVANRNPNGGVATALYNLVAPQAPFVVLLEAFSEPLATFANRITTGWKSSEGQQELLNRYQIDLPLSSIYDNSFKLLSEDPEADLYTFSRTRCPPVLLIPFWDPPLMTRTELSQNNVMTSMPCSPLAYFVWRLFLYATRRATARGRRILSFRRLNSLSAWIRAAEEVLTDLFSEGRVPTEFPFYDKVLAAFTQQYVGPDVDARMRGQHLLEDVMWSASSTIGALLLFAPYTVAHRTVTQPLRESGRSPIYDSSLLAQIVVTVPYLTRTYLTLNGAPENEPRRSNMRITSEEMLVGDDFANDDVSFAASDVLRCKRAFYRNCLISLRECAVSLEGFSNCKSIHFNNTLELWLRLMDPRKEPRGDVNQKYILHHSEAYTFLTESTVKMMERSSFILSLDIVGATLLQRCLSVLAQETAARILDAIEQATTESNELVNSLSTYFVLNWEDDMGGISIVNVRGTECCDCVAHIYVMMERMLAKGEISDDMQRTVVECMRLFTIVFPSAYLYFDKWRSASLTASSKPVLAAPTPTSQRENGQDLLSEEEKKRFFNGITSFRHFPSRTMKLSTNNGRIPGGHHPTFAASLKNEIPLLIGITRFLDAFIAKGTELYYGAWIPKCDAGHDLWLLHSSNYCCSQHPSETAIWECGICEKVYGICCRSSPVSSDGTKMQCTRADGINSRFCTMCGELFPKRTVVFFAASSEAILCPDCASRPFTPVSVRWLASYTTWAIVLTVICTYLFFRVFLF